MATPTWAELLEAAEGGDLFLDPDVGRAAQAACDRYIEQLQDILASARNVEWVAGFAGGFPSSAALEAKFAAKADNGPASIQARLREHIDAVVAMRAVVAQAIARFEATDEHAAAQFHQLDP